MNNNKSHNSKIKVELFNGDNVTPLVPIFSNEFPNWSGDKIKCHIHSFSNSCANVSGVLLAKNEAQYIIGILLYRFIENNVTKTNQKQIHYKKYLKITEIFTFNNLFQNETFLALFNYTKVICLKNSCSYVELPNKDNKYNKIKDKNKNQIVSKTDASIYFNFE
jgi:hypothetical protein